MASSAVANACKADISCCWRGNSRPTLSSVVVSGLHAYRCAIELQRRRHIARAPNEKSLAVVIGDGRKIELERSLARHGPGRVARQDVDLAGLNRGQAVCCCGRDELRPCSGRRRSPPPARGTDRRRNRSNRPSRDDWKIRTRPGLIPQTTVPRSLIFSGLSGSCQGAHGKSCAAAQPPARSISGPGSLEGYSWEALAIEKGEGLVVQTATRQEVG